MYYRGSAKPVPAFHHHILSAPASRRYSISCSVSSWIVELNYHLNTHPIQLTDFLFQSSFTSFPSALTSLSFHGGRPSFLPPIFRYLSYCHILELPDSIWQLFASKTHWQTPVNKPQRSSFSFFPFPLRHCVEINYQNIQLVFKEETSHCGWRRNSNLYKQIPPIN